MRIQQVLKESFELVFKKSYCPNAFNLQHIEQQNKQLLKFTIMAVTVVFLVEPSILWAADSSANAFGKVEGVITKITDAMTGSLGTSLATIGIIVLGVMAMFGKLAWDLAIKAILGLSLVFGSASIITWIKGV
jgi:type IV secretory pathway VirB2 component (pilin)